MTNETFLTYKLRSRQDLGAEYLDAYETNIQATAGTFVN